MGVAQPRREMTYRREMNERRCAFCGRPRAEVRKLVAGPNVYICDRCVSVCRQLLTDDRRVQPSPAREEVATQSANNNFISREV